MTHNRVGLPPQGLLETKAALLREAEAYAERERNPRGEIVKAIKPGTRCECQDIECLCSEHKSFPADPIDDHEWHHVKCEAEAVRLVTVPYGASGFSPFIKPLTENVPFCAACAEYHEAKAGAK